MTGDNSGDTASEFMHALAASDADVTHISAEEVPGGVEVSFNLLDEDDIDLVREIANEYGFERRVDGISAFVLYKERED